MNNTLDLKYELERLLVEKDLDPHFQPIIDIHNGTLIAFEALIRGPKGSPLHLPNALFQTAIQYQLSNELELLCRELSLRKYAQLALKQKLFLNINTSVHKNSDHSQGFIVDLLKQYGVAIEQVVIEISEQHPFDNESISKHAVQYYRDMGFKVAIDNLGSGYSGLKLWSELQPDYVKIDKHFIANIHDDAIKREFVKAIYNIGQTLGSEILAEGIETQQELMICQNIGVSLGQGYFLGYPISIPPKAYPISQNILQSSMSAWPLEPQQETAQSLATQPPTVRLDALIGFVDQLFKSDVHLSAIPVVENGQPYGIIQRSELLELYSKQYGRALYEKKPISRIMQSDILIIESHLSLDEVSRLVTNNPKNTVIQDIIIVKQGIYIGIGHVKDLLKRITDLKVINARHSNPLTLLPGNVSINKKINRLLKHQQNFYVAYFDLNHFKPFNDFYGYAKGDQVIRELGQILQNYAKEELGNFIGHIGGDDFVVIYRSENWKENCINIINYFDKNIRKYYQSKQLTEGGVWSVDRKNEPAFFKILSLAIGVVHPDPKRCSSHNEVAELTASAKKEAKKQDKSSLFISRRRFVISGEIRLSQQTTNLFSENL